MNGWEMRADRLAAGLTLREVARAAGTSETNASAYERSAKRPNAKTLRRIAAVIAAGRNSPIITMNLLTVPAACAALRAGLRAQWETADLLRLVREMRSGAQWLASEADREAFYAEPSTTGDQRWDVLVAGWVEEMHLRDSRPAPGWTACGSLPKPWWVDSSPSLRAYAFAYSPFSMQVRGVMLDPASLESV